MYIIYIVLEMFVINFTFKGIIILYYMINELYTKVYDIGIRYNVQLVHTMF